MVAHSAACADCGATGCDAQFHACLAADFTDPDYGRVHHLVVPAYGLQHGWYTVEAEAEVVEYILEHLDRSPSDDARRGIRAISDGPVRVRARQPRARSVEWERHVGDVDRSNADSYVATVGDWAMSVAAALRHGEAGRRDP